MISYTVFCSSQCLPRSTCGEESSESRCRGMHISISSLQWSGCKFRLLVRPTVCICRGHGSSFYRGLTQYTSLKRSTSGGGCSCSFQRVTCFTTSSRAWWHVLWIFDRAKGSVMFSFVCEAHFLARAPCQRVLRARAVGAPFSLRKYILSLLTAQQHAFVTVIHTMSFHMTVFTRIVHILWLITVTVMRWC